MRYELRATRVGLDCAVEWCKPKEATQFSVYVGTPGAFHWVADFADYAAACTWANYMARSRGVDFVDHVKQEMQ